MLEKYLNKLLGDFWFRRCLVIVCLVYTFHLTNWGTKFAVQALADKADLVGTAGILTAIAGIPLALITMVFKWYDEKKKEDVDTPN